MERWTESMKRELLEASDGGMKFLLEVSAITFVIRPTQIQGAQMRIKKRKRKNIVQLAFFLEQLVIEEDLESL